MKKLGLFQSHLFSEHIHSITGYHNRVNLEKEMTKVFCGETFLHLCVRPIEGYSSLGCVLLQLVIGTSSEKGF